MEVHMSVRRFCSSVLLPLLLIVSVDSHAAVRLYSVLSLDAMQIVPQPATPAGMDLQTHFDHFGVTLADGTNSSHGTSSATLSTDDYSMGGSATNEQLALSIQGQPKPTQHPGALTWASLIVQASGTGSIHVSIPYSWVLTRDSPAEQARVEWFAIDQWYLLDNHHHELLPGELEQQGTGWLEFDMNITGSSSPYRIDLANYGYAQAAPVPELPPLLLVALGVPLMLWRHGRLRAHTAPRV